MNRISGVSGGVAAGGRAGAASAQEAAAPNGGVSAAADGVAGAEAKDQLRVSAAAPPVGLAGMLALQEAATEAARNGKGRRHGLAVLDALRKLQGDLLRETGDGEAGMRAPGAAGRAGAGSCGSGAGGCAFGNPAARENRIATARRGNHLIKPDLPPWGAALACW